MSFRVRDTLGIVNAAMIVELAAASVDRPEFQRRLLDGVMRHVGADVGVLRIGDAGPALTRGFSTRILRASGNPFTRHAAELAPVLAAAKHAGSAVDADVLGQRRVRSTRYFSEVVGPHGGGETLYAIPSWRGRPIACLVLGRCGLRGRFGHADIGRLHTLLPAMALASDAFQKADLREPHVELSPRELEIVRFLVRGFRSREIGQILGTSVNTVRNQVSRLMARLGVGTRAELVTFLRRDEF